MTDPRRKRMALAACIVLVLSLAVAVPQATASGEPSSTKQDAPAKPVDINRASETELTRLPGVGEAMAKRIVAFRDEHGPFERAEDLMKVKGIGEKSFQKLKPHVRVTKKG